MHRGHYLPIPIGIDADDIADDIAACSFKLKSVTPFAHGSLLQWARAQLPSRADVPFLILLPVTTANVFPTAHRYSRVFAPPSMGNSVMFVTSSMKLPTACKKGGGARYARQRG